MPALEPAVTYYRMSDDKQEASIPQQRAEVLRYAARHGYVIVREYIDEGISGDATEKRVQFQKMLADAKERGDFEVVLCWDQDRFGRFDPLEAGYWIKPLRDVGVRLETVAQGRIDWDDFAGQIVYAVQQGGKHQFLRDISRNTTRGHLSSVVEKGRWQGGPAPYAYVVVDGKLALGDPERVEVVRWLFRTYADGAMTIRAMAAHLNARGVPSPAGGLWYDNTIHKILIRRAYVGDAVWNRRHEGKYHAVVGGEVTARKRGAKREELPADQWVIRPDAHPAIVDRETFGRVQRRLAETPSHGTRRRPGALFLLSRLLYCGNCRSAMIGSSKHSTFDAEGNVCRRYICGGYHHHGGAACSCNTMTELPLVRAVIRKVASWFRDERNRAALEGVVRKKAGQSAEAGAGPEQALRSRLAELNRQIDQGNANLALLPPDRLAGVVAKVREWEEQRRAVQADLDALSGASRADARDIDARVEEALALLEPLADRVHEADPAHLHRVLRQVVSKVECWFTPVPFGPHRKRGLFTRGLVSVRPDLIITHVTSDSPLMMRLRAGNMPASGSCFIGASLTSAPAAATSSARPACSGG
jgi:DNA invertase Pin-like site-specific DNA recombinase